MLGQLETALRMRREVYAGMLKLIGEQHKDTLREAGNYALLLCRLKHYAEAKSLLLKMVPVARRVLGNLSLIHI